MVILQGVLSCQYPLHVRLKFSTVIRRVREHSKESSGPGQVSSASFFPVCFISRAAQDAFMLRQGPFIVVEGRRVRVRTDSQAVPSPTILPPELSSSHGACSSVLWATCSLPLLACALLSVETGDFRFEIKPYFTEHLLFPGSWVMAFNPLRQGSSVF